MATMFNPPEELHKGFDKAVGKLKANLGKEYGMIIDGKDVFADDKFEDRSPVNTDWVLAVMQKGNATHANMAIDAARKAFPAWSRTPWQKRVQLVRKAAAMIEKRIFELGAAMALEVGKNRMESLGDVQETADLMYFSAQMMEENDGFIKPMGKDPLVGYDSTNISVLRPYGVWLVVSPFNFPFALTGGPTGAALVAGNTVVIKPATDTAWIVRLYAECLRDAGFPDGVVNFVTGPGSTLGQALVDNPEVDGVDLHRLVRRGHEDVPRLCTTAITSARSSLNSAERIPPSFRAMQILKTRRLASSARRLACRDRNARRPHA